MATLANRNICNKTQNTQVSSPTVSQRRIVMLDFELHAEFHNHSIVKIGSVVGDDPFGDTITAYEVMLDKSGYNVLCN